MIRRPSRRATAPPPGEADRGALSLSYAVILPIVLMFIMIVIQASFWFLAREAALAAARQGADAARVLGASPAARPAAAQAAALAFAEHSGAGYLLDPWASTKGSTASTMTVTVTGHVPTFVPGLVVHVSETAQAPVEEFQP
jgi:Flp pilus assembly protein TadG